MSQPTLEQRVRDLERKLSLVQSERDDLLKDVEALAISNGSSMFSSSYVLSERVSAVDQVKPDHACNRPAQFEIMHGRAFIKLSCEGAQGS